MPCNFRAETSLRAKKRYRNLSLTQLLLSMSGGRVAFNVTAYHATFLGVRIDSGKRSESFLAAGSFVFSTAVGRNGASEYEGSGCAACRTHGLVGLS